MSCKIESRKNVNRKKSSCLYIVGLVIFLSGLCGCGRVGDWLKQNFKQAKTVDGSLVTIKRYTRSTAQYDQLSTVAYFDAVWLSDDVRQVYVNLQTHALGKGEEYKRTLLKRQKEESNRFIMFYILVPYTISFGESDSQWNVTLFVDEDRFSPVELKSIELSPVNQYMLSKLYSRFKNVYQCKFDAHDIDDYPLINEDTQKIELRFASPNKEASLVWSIPEFSPHAIADVL